MLLSKAYDLTLDPLDMKSVPNAAYLLKTMGCEFVICAPLAKTESLYKSAAIQGDDGLTYLTGALHDESALLYGTNAVDKGYVDGEGRFWGGNRTTSIPTKLAKAEPGNIDYMHTATAPQAGSNPGGFYTGSDGKQRYVKTYQDPAQAYGEHLANKVYEHLGVHAPKSAVMKHPSGKTIFASEIIPGNTMDRHQHRTPENAKKFFDGFAADVLLGNWDSTGLSGDNALAGHDGNVYRIDNGGSLLMRAKAGRKPVGALHQISEVERFFDPSNPGYSRMANVAGYSSPDDIHHHIVNQVSNIVNVRNKFGNWHNFVDAHIPELNEKDRHAMGDMLESRTQLLRDRFLPNVNKSEDEHFAQLLATVTGHMKALVADQDKLWHLARLLAPSDAVPVPVQDDDDPESAALLSWGLPDDDEHRDLLDKLLAMTKSEPDNYIRSLKVTADPSLPESVKVAAGLQDGIKHGLAQEVKLHGKHSAGMLAVMDGYETQRLWLLKPGSGEQSPAAGIRELPISQARRETGFAAVARQLLPKNYADAHLVNLNGRETAALQLIPQNFVQAQKLKADGHKVFAKAMHEGRIWRWAAIDYVLGNVDRHGGNVLVGNGGAIVLIDHGSSLAGSSFNAQDPDTYAPYYLRVWVPEWKNYSPEERYKKLPPGSQQEKAEFKAWLNQVFTIEKLDALKVFAPEAYPACLDRLNRLRSAVDPIDELNRIWSGMPAQS